MTLHTASLSMATRCGSSLFETRALRNSCESKLVENGPATGLVLLKARTSMVDGFPYKEEVGGSSPSVPTKPQREVKFFAES